MNSLRPLVVLALFCIAAGQSMAEEISGNYELLVCKSMCSFEQPQSAIAKGNVVVSEAPLPSSAVEKLGLLDFVRPSEARGCFSGARSKGAETFAFLINAGAISWAFKDNLLTFELYRSPDAGYEVELERKGNVLVGKGISWGAGAAAPHHTPDVVVARRSGPVNISACLRPAT